MKGSDGSEIIIGLLGADAFLGGASYEEISTDQLYGGKLKTNLQEDWWLLLD